MTSDPQLPDWFDHDIVELCHRLNAAFDAADPMPAHLAGRSRSAAGRRSPRNGVAVRNVGDALTFVWSARGRSVTVGLREFGAPSRVHPWSGGRVRLEHEMAESAIDVDADGGFALPPVFGPVRVWVEADGDEFATEWFVLAPAPR